MRKPMPELICQCGCGQRIPPSEKHRYKPVRFMLGHLTPEIVQARNKKIAEARTLSPPEGWEPADGFCQCGCGGKTKIAAESRPSTGIYAGFPHRYIQGHQARGKYGPDTPGWKGGRWIDNRGYVRVLARTYDRDAGAGYVSEHRAIYAKSRGIVLPDSVHIHHINGIKTDNHPGNLIAYAPGVHARAHRIAQSIAAIFLDDKLLALAKAYVRTHGALPDLEELTHVAYPRLE